MTRPPPFPNYPLFSPGAPLIRDLRTFDARKTSTRRGRIGTSCPVFGLRPTRWPLSRTVKLPNDEIFTDSPRAKASTTSDRIVATRSRSEEHTSELQSRQYLVCRLLLEKKNNITHASSANTRC